MKLDIDPQDLIDALCEDNGPQTKDILKQCLGNAVSQMQQELWLTVPQKDRIKGLEGECERLQHEVNSLLAEKRAYIAEDNMREHGLVRIYATPKSKDHKIPCIKNIRDWTGLGLKVAKDAVESMIDVPSHFVEAPKVMNIHDDLLKAIFRFEVIE